MNNSWGYNINGDPAIYMPDNGVSLSSQSYNDLTWITGFLFYDLLSGLTPQ